MIKFNPLKHYMERYMKYHIAMHMTLELFSEFSQSLVLENYKYQISIETNILRANFQLLISFFIYL
jgi:hypothetical protein